MKLIIGLGNPGTEYYLTRHNIGFLVAEEIGKGHHSSFRHSKKFKAIAGEGIIGCEDVYLLMPQTYMNMAGVSARAALNWLNIDLKEMLVVLDDISLPFGSMRIKPRGSSGGHKGLGSIINCIGSNDFPRLRIGISGKKVIKDVSGYVLSNFTRPEQKALPDILKNASLVCQCWIEEGIDVAMNKFNGRI